MIYVTGDIHGDISRFSDDKLKFMKAGDTLIVCGDFGFIWNDDKKEDRVLSILGKKRYNICFIDGTHDKTEILETYPEKIFAGGKVHTICGNLMYLERGEIYTIEGSTIFTMGGGDYSEQELRFSENSVRMNTYPTKLQMINAVERLDKENYNVDIIITHEPPSKTKDFLMMDKEEKFEVTPLEKYFDEIANQCRYKKWFFGSMHIDKNISVNQIAAFKGIYNAKTGLKIV